MAPLKFFSEQPAPGGKRSGFSGCVVALVGLPGRGKTCLAHKLQRYLSASSKHQAKVFRVSDYRQLAEGQYTSHEFFSVTNCRGRRVRERSVLEAARDALTWLSTDTYNTFAILDGNHVSKNLREAINSLFKQVSAKVLFVECINESTAAIERNVLDILRRCKDYKGMDLEIAVHDFQLRLEHCAEEYTPLGQTEERAYSYIQIFNEGEDIHLHRLEGPYQNRVLNFLTNYKFTPQTLYFSRHGESEFNVTGRIGGDACLSARGKLYARALADHINGRIHNLQVWTSSKVRTQQTASFIHHASTPISALDEIDAGVCEGLTYEEVAEQWPKEFAKRDANKLTYRYPGGESYLDVVARLEPVAATLHATDSPVLVISHQAVLRALLSYFAPPKSKDDIPYVNIPLHTVIKLSPDGYNWNVEYIPLNVDCVDTYRKQPKNCSVTRSNEEALATVPAHLDSL